MTSLLSGLFFSNPKEGQDSLGSHSSGYGGNPSGYSGSGIDRSSGYGHHSGGGHGGGGGGYGHSGGHSGGYSGHSGHSGGGHSDKCCPLVVDALCLAAIIGSIGGATVLLSRVIQIEINAPGRRRKRSLLFTEFVLEGKHAFATNMSHIHKPVPELSPCHIMW